MNAKKIFSRISTRRMLSNKLSFKGGKGTVLAVTPKSFVENKISKIWINEMHTSERADFFSKKFEKPTEDNLEGDKKEEHVIEQEIKNISEKSVRIQEDIDKVVERLKEHEKIIEEHAKIIEDQKKQLHQLEQDKLLLLSETENIRNIGRQEVAKAKEFGIQSFATKLLDVADNLERALDSVPKEELEKIPQLKLLHEGLHMTNLELHKVFKNHGVTPIEAEGQSFDPNYHQALFRVPAQKQEDHNKIAQVVKKGYTIGKRVIRPAHVGVVVHSPEEKTE